VAINNKGFAIDLDETGRPARAIPDPRKSGTHFSQRLLPQIPRVAIPKPRIRRTAGTTKRGSR
jgi:hypothetical protein